MTAQLSDNLVVQHPEIDFGDLSLYATSAAGDILDPRNRSMYRFVTQADESKFTMFSLSL